MRHASFPAAGISSLQYASDSKTIRRRSIFAAVIAALHHSRRLQARRILRQYQHLISPPKEGRPQNLNPNIGSHENAGE